MDTFSGSDVHVSRADGDIIRVDSDKVEMAEKLGLTPVDPAEYGQTMRMRSRLEAPPGCRFLVVTDEEARDLYPKEWGYGYPGPLSAALLLRLPRRVVFPPGETTDVGFALRLVCLNLFWSQRAAYPVAQVEGFQVMGAPTLSAPLLFRLGGQAFGVDQAGSELRLSFYNPGNAAVALDRGSVVAQAVPCGCWTPPQCWSVAADSPTAACVLGFCRQEGQGWTREPSSPPDDAGQRRAGRSSPREGLRPAKDAQAAPAPQGRESEGGKASSDAGGQTADPSRPRGQEFDAGKGHGGGRRSYAERAEKSHPPGRAAAGQWSRMPQDSFAAQNSPTGAAAPKKQNGLRRDRGRLAPVAGAYHPSSAPAPSGSRERPPRGADRK